MREKILIMIPGRVGEVQKQQIIESFLKKVLSAQIFKEVLEELDNIGCIQVYKDHVVRLHFNTKDHFRPNTSKIIEKKYYGEILEKELIKLLQNKKK